MKPLYPDEYWKAEIKWSPPVAYERVRDNGHELDDEANLYLISARYSNNKSKGIYIGKTWTQTVFLRLKQPDHKKRYISFIEKYPRHKFFISYGCVTVLNGKKWKSVLMPLKEYLFMLMNLKTLRIL